MGFHIAGFSGGKIDPTYQMKNETNITSTSKQEGNLKTSQENETYDYTGDVKKAEGSPTTTTDTTSDGGTQVPGQSGTEKATGYSTPSNTGANQGGPDAAQTGTSSFETGSSQGGNVGTSGIDMEMNSGDAKANELNTNIPNAGSSEATTSQNMNNSVANAGVGQGGGTEIKVESTGVSMYSPTDMPDQSTFFNEGRAYVITGHNPDGSLTAEDITEDFVAQLSNIGFNEKDINRILNGEITIKELFVEIQSDLTSDRYNKIMENTMIQAIRDSNKEQKYDFFVFNNMDELNAFVADKEKDLAKMIEERNTADDHELDAIEMIITKLNEGYSLEQALRETVAWSYVDLETGEIKYVYTDPYADMSYIGNTGDSVMYKPLTFEEMYGESEYLDQIKEHCYEQTINHWFRDDEIVHRWDNYDNATREFYLDMLDKVYEKRDGRAKKLKELNEQIEKTVEEIDYCTGIKIYIENENEYYSNNVRKYIINDDFLENCSYDPTIKDDILHAMPSPNYNSGSYDRTTHVNINDKEMVVKYILAMANGDIPPSNYLLIGLDQYQIGSTDPTLQFLIINYADWLSQTDENGNPTITEEEIAVLNYIYNTSDNPIEDLYNYLKYENDTNITLADKLDERWVYNQQKKDEEFVKEWGGVVASIATVFHAPVEGIGAAIYSYSAVLNNQKIARSGVYSSSDVIRGTISNNIGETYGKTWQFVYDTGMSMADSAYLIALTYATGGGSLAIRGLLSAGLMGSRAYVSTLNDALDRGLDDKRAVFLATSSAVVETAMESYSLGHLFNLEGALNIATGEITAKIGEMFTDPAANKFVTKAMYCLAGSISQGFAEGEEEFCTEVLNTTFDLYVAKDKSKIELSAAYYRKLGLTDEEISNRLMIDFSGQLLEAFKGGFFSGLAFGLLGSAKTTHLTSYGLANGLYSGNINTNTSFSNQFTEALKFNEEQQDAVKKVESSYSIKNILFDLFNKEITIQEALLSLRRQAIFNNALEKINAGDENSLTTEEKDVLEAYKLIENGIIEQNVKSLFKEDIIRKIKSIFYGFKAPSLVETIRTAKEYSGELSLYSGQFRLPNESDLSSVSREEQVYSNAFYAMIQTGNRVGLTEVGALERLELFIKTGRTDYITRRFNCRNTLMGYTNAELQVALERIRQNITNKVNDEVQKAIDNIAELYNITEREASTLVEAYIKGQKLSNLRFPDNFNSAELDTIKIKYNMYASYIGQYDYSAIYKGIESYNRVLDLQNKMDEVAQKYAGSLQFKTYEDVLSYLTNIAKTGNIKSLYYNIAEPLLYSADVFEFSRAIDRLTNSYFKSKEIENILFKDFWNSLMSGRKSDINAARTLYHTFLRSYYNGNQYAAQAIKVIMDIKKKHPNFCLTSKTYSEGFFSRGENRVELGKNHTAMVDCGTTTHELGHCFFWYTASYRVPTAWNNISQQARDRMTYDNNAIRALGQLETTLRNITQTCDLEAEAQYASMIMQTEGKLLDEYKKTLAKSLEDRINRNVFSKWSTIKEFSKTLEKLGCKSEYIKELTKEFKEQLNTTKAAETIVAANIWNIRDRLIRTKYSDFGALSDIVSAMTYGENVDKNGYSIFLPYNHSSDYYKYKDMKKGILYSAAEKESLAFNEIIANYTQLMLTGTNNNIEYLNDIFGQDFVDILYATFTSNIYINELITFPYELNFVKVQETLNILDYINGITEAQLPIFFENIKEYHEWFIKTLVKNVNITSINDSKVLDKLLENPTFKEYLLTEFDISFKAAIDSKLSEKTIFSIMTPKQFDTYLKDSKKASLLLQNMTPTQLGNLLTNMDSNTFSWMNNQTIKSTIFSYNAEQLSEFLDSCNSLNFDVLYNNLGNSQWSVIIDNFYSDLISNFVHMNYLSEHPELTPKLRNIIPAHTNSKYCETAFNIVDGFQYVYTSVQALQPGSQNYNSNKKIINDIIKATSYPAIFASSEQFKEVFLNTLMKSPIYSQLGNDIIFELIKDPVFLNKLAGSTRIDSLLTKNLDTDLTARMILPYLTSGTQQSFDKIMNTSAMKQYISRLSATELSVLISRMKDTHNWWIVNDTIMSNILSFNANEMTIFLGGFKYLNLHDNIINNQSNINFILFLNKLTLVTNISDFEANPSLYHLVNYIYKSLGNYSSGNMVLNNQLHNLENNLKIMQNNIAQKIVASAPQNLQANMTIDSDARVKIIADSSYKQYNLTIEVNGKTTTLQVLTPFSIDDKVKISISECFIDSTVVESIISGNFKIISVTPNLVHDVLYVRNLQPGLYQATYVVDGIEYTAIKESQYGSIDFGYDHKTGQTAELKSITYLGDMKIDKIDGISLDDNSIYKMTYIEEGITKVLYISSQGGVINLNNIISELKTNRMDFSSLSIEKVENTQELFARVKDLTDGLFAGDVYGGNQNNPELYLDSFFKSNGSMFEMDMGSRISNMIETFFPELTTMSYSEQRDLKMRLAELYADSGCSYMAFANMVTQYLSSIENGAQIYENAFGIPMQISEKYTEEFLAISFCISGVSKETNGKLANLTADIIDELGWPRRYIKYITEYLAERGIKIETKHFDAGTTNARSNLLSTTVSSPGSFCIIRASEFDLELLSTSSRTGKNTDAATASSITVGKIIEKVGGHAMLITGVTEAGEIIVSSWSEKYRFIPESLKKYRDSRSGMWKVDISLAQNITGQTTPIIDSASTAVELSNVSSIEFENESLGSPIVQNNTTPLTIDVNSQIKDLLSQTTITDQVVFDTKISSLLEYGLDVNNHPISLIYLLELENRYGSQSGEIIDDINEKLGYIIDELIDKNTVSDIKGSLGTEELKELADLISIEERINIVTYLMLNGTILTGQDFITLIPIDSALIESKGQDIQLLMNKIFKSTVLSDTDIINLIETITEIANNISKEKIDQDFIEELITNYCISPNYKSFDITKETRITIFNNTVFSRLNNNLFVQELLSTPGFSAQAAQDLSEMATVLLEERKKTLLKRRLNIALKGESGGFISLLREKYKATSMDNYWPFMIYTYTNKQGKTQFITLQAIEGLGKGATHHWYDISQIGTGHSSYESGSAVNTKIKDRILAAAGITTSTPTNADYKSAANKLFTQALKKVARGEFVIPSYTGNIQPGRKYDPDTRTITCYVDASEISGKPFYLEIMYVPSLTVGDVKSLQVYHMTPLSKSNLIIDEYEGLIVKDSKGKRCFVVIDSNNKVTLSDTPPSTTP